MNQVIRLIVVLVVMILSIAPGCTVPESLLKTVSSGDAVAQSALINPPQNIEDIQGYFEVNAKLWRELAIYYGLKD